NGVGGGDGAHRRARACGHCARPILPHRPTIGNEPARTSFGADRGARRDVGARRASITVRHSCVTAAARGGGRDGPCAVVGRERAATALRARRRPCMPTWNGTPGVPGVPLPGWSAPPAPTVPAALGQRATAGFAFLTSLSVDVRNTAIAQMRARTRTGPA